MGGDEKIPKQDGREKETNFNGRDIIIELYNRLIELGYQYKDLYDMTIQELMDTLENRRIGLAYEIWKISSLCHSPFVKNFPESPKEACKELYPKEKGIPMPTFLRDKAIKRGVL